MHQKYLANREFTKNIRHNGRNYILRSVFDNDFGFDDAISKVRKKRHFRFDDTIQKYLFNSYGLQDDLDSLYDTGLLD